MKRYFYALMAVGLALAGCHSGHDHEHEGHDHEAEAAEKSHKHGEDVIELTKAQAKAAGIATESVVPQPFEASIRVSGQVTTAQGDEAALVARSGGIVSFVRDHLTEGVAVRQGELLARIAATGIAGGDEVARTAQQLETARKALDRAEALAKDSLIAQKEYERIKAEYEQAQLSMGDGKESGSTVTSPLSGYLRSVLVKEGEYVEAGRIVATVTKSCNLQLRAEVPEKYYRMANQVRSAQFEMSYGGGVHELDSLHGHLVSVGQAASESSAYLPVTFEFVNDGCIVPGSFADIWLLTERREGVLCVPHEAVSEEQGIHYIYIALHKGHHEYVKREVRLGMENGRHVEVLSGLKAGEHVVVRGVTQVRLAANTGAIPEAHSHNH